MSLDMSDTEYRTRLREKVESPTCEPYLDLTPREIRLLLDAADHAEAECYQRSLEQQDVMAERDALRADRDWHATCLREQAEALKAARAELSSAQAAIQRVRDECDTAAHGALRWNDPLPIPEWVPRIRAVLDAVSDARRTGDEAVAEAEAERDALRAELSSAQAAIQRVQAIIEYPAALGFSIEKRGEQFVSLNQLRRALDAVVSDARTTGAQFRCERCIELGMESSAVGPGPCPWHPGYSRPIRRTGDDDE